MESQGILAELVGLSPGVELSTEPDGGLAGVLPKIIRSLVASFTASLEKVHLEGDYPLQWNLFDKKESKE